MTAQEDVQETLPLVWQHCVNKLKATLKRRDLLTVMDEVLSPATFKFDQSSLHGRDALRVSLGYRKQNDGKTIAVRAYILHDGIESEPSIVFRDEVPVNSNGATTTKLYPRPAASLLRKASHLQPPFCFLQQEIDEGVKDGRGMLCAVVAYYALVAGMSDRALRWRRFDACLIAALNHINRTVGMPTAKHGMQPQNATMNVEIISKAGGGASQPINFPDGDHRLNKRSLIVRLELDSQALAEIIGVSQLPQISESQYEEGITLLNKEVGDDAVLFDPSIAQIDEETEELPHIPKTMQQSAVVVFEEQLDGVDSVIGDDVDSVEDEVDSVIEDTNDDIIGTASKFEVGDNEQTIHRPPTSKRRKLEQSADNSNGSDFEETDGYDWRQAACSRSNRR
jgi:hypothetical protein